ESCMRRIKRVASTGRPFEHCALPSDEGLRLGDVARKQSPHVREQPSADTYDAESGPRDWGNEEQESGGTGGGRPQAGALISKPTTPKATARSWRPKEEASGVSERRHAPDQLVGAAR